MGSNLQVIVLEPYYGGSHRAFLDGLAATLPFSFDFYTLPARSWKWRMRLAAPYYAELFRKAGPAAVRQPCRLLCSSYVDVAAFKALAPDWLGEVPIHTYFHENQFAYPVRIDDERDYHYALTNLTTALASQRIAFNSRYNLESFLAGSRELLKKNHDIPLADYEDEIIGRADILHPGIDFAEIDAAAGAGGHEVPVIVWNHRWEHDKNPERFFEALFELSHRRIPFRVIVLGQSFSAKPGIFDKARRILQKEIIHFGFTPSRKEYISWLKQGDLVVSTAGHEFYGISVIEAVRAGCRPLLPGRLSYPELFPEEFLYQDRNLPERLLDALGRGRLSAGRSRGLTDQFSWQYSAPQYRQWLGGGRLKVKGERNLYPFTSIIFFLVGKILVQEFAFLG